MFKVGDIITWNDVNKWKILSLHDINTAQIQLIEKSCTLHAVGAILDHWWIGMARVCKPKKRSHPLTDFFKK